ncbi:Nucleoside diphosphate kinase 6 [Strongyloides ratti]|uniref:Nucleoside diphosphate kinase 6 n=1 Tax=Strongyloides ratti TaxID=34506 RepID=A0A090MWV9_STRRB|nr:Nucleoside diphosphate kinase 6 [Strongyloides ratti]CEF64364.1 Nucleoside diphosphate kinase 6 [Strongyloides ratti]
MHFGVILLMVSRQLPNRGHTFALLKPDITSNPIILKKVIERIVDEGLLIVGGKRLTLTKEIAGELYKEHEGKFFYNRLITHVCSGPVIALKLTTVPESKNDPVKLWRNLLGPSKLFKNWMENDNSESLRNSFSLSDTRNVGHGSDTILSTERELKIFEPFDLINGELIEKESLINRLIPDLKKMESDIINDGDNNNNDELVD